MIFLLNRYYFIYKYFKHINDKNFKYLFIHYGK